VLRFKRPMCYSASDRSNRFPERALSPCCASACCARGRPPYCEGEFLARSRGAARPRGSPTLNIRRVRSLAPAWDILPVPRNSVCTVYVDQGSADESNDPPNHIAGMAKRVQLSKHALSALTLWGHTTHMGDQVRRSGKGTAVTTGAYGDEMYGDEM